MAVRDTPRTVDAILADILERLRRIEERLRKVEEATGT